jgi:3-hydroxyisobutyrate dehydrogenase-like beta-hydroxyacid dehydrogenase
MTRIAFIGLGNMGGGMAANQAKAQHHVSAFDLSAAALEKAVAAGCHAAGSVAEAVAEAEVVITMLPAGPHVRGVYGDQILAHAPKSALLIDCSTIDVESARAVAGQARAAGFRFADAPVSGGIMAAEAGTLAFMVGCDAAGVGPSTPADRGYEGGFATAMMLMDLKLAQDAAAKAGASTPMGAQAEALYALFDGNGFGGKDFSAVLQMLRGKIADLN